MAGLNTGWISSLLETKQQIISFYVVNASTVVLALAKWNA
jgi:hypothetical protein